MGWRGGGWEWNLGRIWKSLEEEEEEEENEGKKEGKKKSKEWIDRLSDRFLTFPFLFFLPPFSIDVFPIFFPPGKKTITHHSASRSHLAFKHISSSLSLPKGPYGPQLPEPIEISSSFAAESKREGERGIMRNSTYLTTSLATSLVKRRRRRSATVDDRRQRDEATAKQSKGKGKGKRTKSAT